METTSTTGSLAGSAQTAEDRLTFSPSSVIMPSRGSTALEGNRNGARPDPAQTLLAVPIRQEPAAEADVGWVLELIDLRLRQRWPVQA